MGLKKELGGNVEVTYAKGYHVPGKKDANTVNWQEASLERIVMGEPKDDEETRKAREEIEANRQVLLEEAVALAKEADEVIFVGGLNHDYDVEGRDRDDMKLPFAQDKLIEALLDVNPNTIVVIVAGSPVEMPWKDRAKAIVWSYFSGMETGTALTDILLGKVSPSGKLPETFANVYEDCVTSRNGEFGKTGSVEYKEGIFVGYRYFEKEKVKPAFAFGHGLSYTDFTMSDLVVKCDKASKTATVSVKVTNTGAMTGAEVVQCYVSDPECSVDRPVKELKGFAKVFLAPGESKIVTMELDENAFAFYDVEKKAFVVEPGTFEIHLGNASDHCTLTEKIEL